METLKKIFQFSFITAIFFLSGNMRAQLPSEKTSSSQATVIRQTDYIAKQLKLEGKQIKDLEQINLLYAQQLSELRQKGGNGNSKTEIEALKRSHSNKIRSLLSSDKYQEYLALKKKGEKDIKKNN